MMMSQTKSGNMKLARGCVYCRHKFECHADANDGKGLRVFKYSTGYRYLTQVPKPPNVIEVTQMNGEKSKALRRCRMMDKNYGT